MKVRFVVLALLVALGLPAAPAVGALAETRSTSSVIDALRRQANAARQKAGLTPLESGFLDRESGSPGYQRWVQAVWKTRLVAALDQLTVPAVWRRIAVCETGGNWKHDNPPFQGGLGFYDGSWDAYRPKAFPAEAYRATPAQQVIVGRRIRADVGWGAWPVCSVRLGLR